MFEAGLAEAGVAGGRLLPLCPRFDTLKVCSPLSSIRRHRTRSAGSPRLGVFYFTASPKGVLVFHAFAKKTQRTPASEIELARKRLEELFDA